MNKKIFFIIPLICLLLLSSCEKDECNHNLTTWITSKEATCLNSGVEEKVCLLCNKALESRYIDNLGHNYVDRECTRCHKILVGELDYELNEDGESYSVIGLGTYETSYIDGYVIIPNIYNNLPVTTIKKYAFHDISLYRMDIPIAVTLIEESTFVHGRINNIYYDGTIEDWCNITFIDKHSNPMYLSKNIYFKNDDNYEKVTDLVIPDTITKIGNYQFYGFKLDNLFIHSNIKKIDYISFCGFVTKNLYYNGTIEDWCNVAIGLDYLSFNIWDNLYIKNSNDEYVDTKSITSIELSNSLTSIGEYAFYNCSSLTSIKLADSITIIGAYAFSHCISLTNIEIPNSVTSIGDGAFYNCSSLTNIELPNNLTSIGEYAFQHCISLTSIEIPNSVKSIGDGTFYNCSSLINIELPNNLISIGKYAFSGCISLTNIEIPNSVTSIGASAFEECSSLLNIEIPNSVTSIGKYAFSWCDNLENVYYDGLVEDWCNIIFDNLLSNPMGYANHFNIKNNTYEYEEVMEIEIPNTITSIGNYQFYGFNNVTKIIIPNSITSIGSGAFYGCSRLENVYYDGIIEDWCNITFSSSTSNSMSSAKHFYINNSNGEYEEVTEIEIPDTVTSIGNYQFYGFNNVTKIILPNSITSIESYAFSGCTSLTIIDLQNSVTSIGSYAFEGCTSLTIIDLPNSITSIESYAFSGCSSLTSIYLPNSITSIGNAVFYKCWRLENVYYEGSLEDWNNITFDGYYSNPMSITKHLFVRDNNGQYQEVTKM